MFVLPRRGNFPERCVEVASLQHVLPLLVHPASPWDSPGACAAACLKPYLAMGTSRSAAQRPVLVCPTSPKEFPGALRRGRIIAACSSLLVRPASPWEPPGACAAACLKPYLAMGTSRSAAQRPVLVCPTSPKEFPGALRRGRIIAACSSLLVRPASPWEPPGACAAACLKPYLAVGISRSVA